MPIGPRTDGTPRHAPRVLPSYMTLSSLTVGKYLVTPLARITASGDYAASVSIRRGMHDRVFRLIPRFDDQGHAMQYALAQGRTMVLQNQLV